MKTTRRNLIQLAGGAAVGALFTPAPWRLLTDSALWSENWPGIPRPARGEILTRFTTCALCDAGCAVKARCVGEQPVSLAGVRGGLCPFGVTAHHLPYHPARLRKGPAQEAAAAYAEALAKRGSGERVAVLDLRPGRTASWSYRRAMAAIGNGVYLAPPRASVSVDFENAKTVVSLGAPILDGWVSPSRIFGLRDRFRLIQVEPMESRTAVLADEWMLNLPGSEEALIQALAGEMSDYQAAAATGLSPEQISSLQRQIAEHGPALVVDPGMSAAVMRLNGKLGGRMARPRAEAPVPEAWKKAAPVTDLASVPDGSVRVLVIDAAAGGAEVPWTEVHRKLAGEHAQVIAFSPVPLPARYVLPTAVYPESLEDVPAGFDSLAPCFRLSARLVAPPAGMTRPAEFLGIAGDPLRERADAIHAAGRGRVENYADGTSTPVKDMAKADDFWKALLAGTWVGDPSEGEPSSPGQAWRTAPQGQRLVSPIMTKLWQESDLRLGPGRVALHPSAGFAESTQAKVGDTRVTVTLDPRVPPGIALIGGWPESITKSSKVVRA